MLRKKEDEKYFKIAVTGVAILLIWDGLLLFVLSNPRIWRLFS